MDMVLRKIRSAVSLLTVLAMMMAGTVCSAYAEGSGLVQGCVYEENDDPVICGEFTESNVSAEGCIYEKHGASVNIIASMQSWAPAISDASEQDWAPAISGTSAQDRASFQNHGRLVLCDSSADTVFADVARENWACSFVERAFRNGAVEGTTKDPVTGKPFYRPDSPMTMAQFATILTRVYYPDDYAANMDPVWDLPAKRVCESSGLIPQEKIDELWSKPITRYEMASLAAKIARSKNVFTDAASDKNAELKLASQSIPAEYYEDVFLVYSLGIIEGTDSRGTFNGGRTMSRAQGATVYCRMAEKVPFYSRVQRVTVNGTGLSLSLDKDFAAHFQLRYGVESAGGAWEGYNCRFAVTGGSASEAAVKLPEDAFTVNTGKDIYLYTALYLSDYNSRTAALKGSDIVPQSPGYTELALKAFTSENSTDWTLRATEYIGLVVDDPADFRTAAAASVKLEEFRSLEQVSDALEKAGCTESQDAFIHALYRAGKADIKHIRTGNHSIPAGASVDDVVRLITK